LRSLSSKKSESTLIGPDKLTRFERARIVGARALQISMGAPILVDLPSKNMSPINVATLELEGGILPISIRRKMPDGTSQTIPLSFFVKNASSK